MKKLVHFEGTTEYRFQKLSDHNYDAITPEKCNLKISEVLPLFDKSCNTVVLKIFLVIRAGPLIQVTEFSALSCFWFAINI